MSSRIDAGHPIAGGLGFLALLGLCAAYVQGGLVKLTDFPGAIGEMTHFGLSPAPLFAVLVIALALGAFTLAASFIALRYWQMPAGQDRFMAANSFYEHLGLAGGFLLVALTDLTSRD
ncbi:DoxX family protein [Paracoccus limosus]|uniref:DoxX family protein n=1 Tax=Paracoccus limosus TaxID=913252 RepID=A0A844H4E8_9RHOB|nr:DoxX family protein [Paracoccus limosus]MTH34340.1 DoxX family protein [Paracoccus limosus]